MAHLTFVYSKRTPPPATMAEAMRSVVFICIGIGSGVWMARRHPIELPLAKAKLVNVVISTSRMDEEAKFYEKTFGFKTFFHNQTSTFLKSGSANLVFVKVTEKTAETKNICLDISVPNLNVALAAMTNADVKVDSTDPHVLKVYDPDGNLVEIVKG